MGAYEGLSSFFNAPLTDYAIKYNYDESNILILEENTSILQKKHLEIYNNLLSCSHQSDSRSALQYGKDLVASWIFEDYFIEQMKNNSFSISLSGADKNRTILANAKTSTACDYVIQSQDGNEYLLELVNDYTGFWTRTHKLHLRDNKYNQLSKNKSILLAISLTHSEKTFSIIDFGSYVNANYLSEHPYWHKPAYELDIPIENLHMFSIYNIQQEILKIIKGRI